jgi:L-lactate dehydrogenase
MLEVSSVSRIVIIGVGHVGATSAYALMLRALVSEIVLIDSNMPLAEAEAADIADANALAPPTRISAGTYADSATAAIAIITAGATTHGSESRLAVMSRSAAIVDECVTHLMTAGFSGTIIVAANPVDIMANVAFKKAGLPAARVIGTGTLLDTGRLRQSLAEKLDVAHSAVTGLVLGEHGDSEVAAFTSVRIGGLSLEVFAGSDQNPDHYAIAKEVRDAGYLISKFRSLGCLKPSPQPPIIVLLRYVNYGRRCSQMWTARWGEAARKLNMT